MQLKTKLRIKKDVNEVFLFFSEASNLEKITPPELRFRITSPMPMELKKDSIIDYKLNLFGIGFKWKTLISHWNPPYSFVDEQISGPYKKWIHTHTFKSEAEETIIEDSVEYELPFSPFSIIVLPIIKLQLKRIFNYRQKMVLKYLMH